MLSDAWRMLDLNLQPLGHKSASLTTGSPLVHDGVSSQHAHRLDTQVCTVSGSQRTKELVIHISQCTCHILSTYFDIITWWRKCDLIICNVSLIATHRPPVCNDTDQIIQDSLIHSHSHRSTRHGRHHQLSVVLINSPPQRRGAIRRTPRPLFLFFPVGMSRHLFDLVAHVAFQC